MLVNVTLPTMAARAVPVDVVIQRILASAQNLRDAAAKAPVRDNFADTLKKSVKAKLASAKSSPVFAESTESSFGEQIKKAAEEKQGDMPTQEQHKDRVESERQRYQQPQPRKRTKGE